MKLTKEQKEGILLNEYREGLEKWDCPECGCYWWVVDRNTADCPNCTKR